MTTKRDLARRLTRIENMTKDRQPSHERDIELTEDDHAYLDSIFNSLTEEGERQCEQLTRLAIEEDGEGQLGELTAADRLLLDILCTPQYHG